MHTDQLVEDALPKKVVWTFCQECDTSLPWEEPRARAGTRLARPWPSLSQPGAPRSSTAPAARGLPAAPHRRCDGTPRKSTKEMSVLRSQNSDTGLPSQPNMNDYCIIWNGHGAGKEAAFPNISEVESPVQNRYREETTRLLQRPYQLQAKVSQKYFCGIVLILIR